MRIERESMHLITTARADQPLKGTQHLIRAVGRLRESRPNVRLTIIGKPKEDGPTERLIQELDLTRIIEFRHGLSTAEIRQLYAASTVAVVPSEYEGFGLPAGEAMACGVPVVSTDGGALPEVVGNAGIVVPAGDPEALAAGVARLLDDPDLRETYSASGRQRIAEHFSWLEAARAMTGLYQRITNT